MRNAYITLLLLLAAIGASASGMRRSISPTQPVWLVHVDNSYGEDVQACIDAIPEDVKPYVVFNLAITSPEDNGRIAEWLGTCQENDVWAMVQCSSGVRNSMSDVSTAQYEQFFEDYPCLIGYNFCEQNWGFDAGAFQTRLELFCSLIELAHRYGGYLYINDSQSISNNPLNTIAKMKASARFARLTKDYSGNVIYGDKTTMGLGYYDNESACLGMFLSGHAGNYAIRFDQYAWSYSGKAQVFGTEYGSAVSNSLAWFTCPEAAMGTSIAEHVMMTGATVIDGPEIPIINCLFGGRQTPAFKNMTCDIVRKILDGTIVIPPRSRVLQRTKVAMVLNSFNTVGEDTPLYEGLYQADGHRSANKTWLKSSGRYATIPTLATIDDAGGFDIVVTQKGGGSAYGDRWQSSGDKTAEFNAIYRQVSTGDMYVGRDGSRLLCYNPYLNTNRTAAAAIPLEYNSCAGVSLTFTPHTFCVISETRGGVDIYLNNYRTDKSLLWRQYPGVSSEDGLPRMTQTSVQQYMRDTFIDSPADGDMRQNVISIAGCTAKPSYSLADRGSHRASSATETFSGGTWTLTITHNGPLEISVACHGGNTGRGDTPDCPQVESVPPPSGRDKETGIAAMQKLPSGNATGSVYTLAGQKAGTGYKGIVIHKGRKILIR